jgi:hypothetical protein
VENSCGKTCGECGKLLVFNRYSGVSSHMPRLWKSLHTGLHKTGYKVVTEKLRYRRELMKVLRKWPKKLHPWGKSLSKAVGGAAWDRNFCENPTNFSLVSFCPPWKYFS